MRLLHTSDWHLGRTLHGYSLAEAQEQAVAFIVRTAIDREVDAVVIAGDVFDRAVPPVEAIRVFNAALESLADAGIPVVVIAGNHDSGDRLATYSALLREGVHIVGNVGDEIAHVELADAHGVFVIYAIPYLDPDATRRQLSATDEPLERSHEAVLRAATDRIAADIAARNGSRAMAVGHAFVADVAAGTDGIAAMSSESERDLTIGGVQVVPAAAFAGMGLAYVALGHLHRPQQVRATSPTVEYSGSILRYSLSEADHEKSVAIVDVDASGGVSIERISIPQPRGMARLTGSMAELLGELGEPHRQDFVELVVTDAAYPERMHARLDDAFPFALVKVHRPAGLDGARSTVRGDARGRDPVEVMGDFIRKVANREPSESELDLLTSAYESARTVG